MKYNLSYIDSETEDLCLDTMISGEKLDDESFVEHFSQSLITNHEFKLLCWFKDKLGTCSFILLDTTSNLTLAGVATEDCIS